MGKSKTHLFENSDLLVRAMGHWPSFHDAGISDVLRAGDACHASLHVFQMTTEVDSNGCYVLTNHHLVTVEMSGVTECTLPVNYEGDVLFDLSAERTGDLIKVEFDSATDPTKAWHVLCREVKVTDVAPCGPNGEKAS